jgi:fatty acid CoA ligase FadD9
MVFAADRTSWASHAAQREALLQEQLLKARDELGRVRYELHKERGGDDGNKDPDTLEKQEKQLSGRVSLLEGKIRQCQKDAQEALDGDSNSGAMAVDELLAIFVCDGCGSDIQQLRELPPDGGSATRFHCFDRCGDFDLCTECAAKLREHGEEQGKPAQQSAAVVRHRRVCRGRWLLPAPTLSPSSYGDRVIREGTSLQSLIGNAFRLFAARPCLGFRARVAGGSRLEDVTTWLSYADVGRASAALARGMLTRKIFAPGDFVGVCGTNRVEWFIADFALLLAGAVVVPIHTYLDDGTLASIAKNCELKAVVCSPETAPSFSRVRVAFREGEHGDSCSSLIEHVVCMPDANSFQTAASSVAHEEGRVRISPSFVELISEGSSSDAAFESPRKDDDIATLVYTSGSTGTPKGAVFTHKLWKALLVEGIDTRYRPVILSKDPLAHISDREDVHTAFVAGGAVAMSSGHESVHSDLGVLEPTRVSSTPRFFEALHAEFDRRLEVLTRESSGEVEEARVRTQLVDEFRTSYGNRLRDVSIGGAASSVSLLDFLRECFGAGVVSEGYGSTEAGGIADEAGRLSAGTAYKLRDVPELGYFSSDEPYPRGELLLKTPTSITTYYRNPGANESGFDADGYICTGDIVQELAERKVRLIDRLKFVFKLSQGEYVAPARAESVFSGSELVEQILVTCADIRRFVQRNVTCVVRPNESVLRKRLTEIGVDCDTLTLAEICQLGLAVELVLKSLRRSGAASQSGFKLRPYEFPRVVLLTDAAWTVENGLMTHSNKLNRLVLQKKYEGAVDEAQAAAQDQPAQTLQDANTEDQVFGILCAEVGAQPGESSSTESFVSLGGDSLAALRAIAAIRQVCVDSGINCRIDSEQLLRPDLSLAQVVDVALGRSASSVSSSVSSPASATWSSPWDADLTLPESFVPKLGALKGENGEPQQRVVFVTGGTGFLGAHVLQRLSREPSVSKVFALVRRVTGFEDPDEVLRSRLSELEVEVEPGKVEGVFGDVSDAGMGLDSTASASIRAAVTDVFHCAAAVHHTKGYSELRDVNVVGTLHVLQFVADACHIADRGVRVALHHVSTTGTLDEHHRVNDTIPEDGALVRPGAFARAGGYTASKTVGEMLVVQFADRFASHLRRVSIIRPGMVGWNTETGCANRQDWLYRLLVGSIVLGAPNPRPMTASLNAVPVNVAAALVTSAILHGSRASSTSLADDTVTKTEGWVTKQGGSVKSWKKRWMTIDGGQLRQYKSERDVGANDPVMAIQITKDMKAMVGDDQKKIGAWKLLTPARIYLFKCENPEDWVDAVNQAIGVASQPNSVLRCYNVVNGSNVGWGTLFDVFAACSVDDEDVPESVRALLGPRLHALSSTRIEFSKWVPRVLATCSEAKGKGFDELLFVATGLLYFADSSALPDDSRERFSTANSMLAISAAGSSVSRLFQLDTGLAILSRDSAVSAFLRFALRHDTSFVAALRQRTST